MIVVGSEHLLLALLGILISVQYTIAQSPLPVDIAFEDLSAEAQTAFQWTVTSTLLTPPNIALYSDQSGSATFQLHVQRAPMGTGHTISGAIVAKNPIDNVAGNVTIDSFRLSLGRNGLFGPAAKTLDCPGVTLNAGESSLCSFSLPVSGGITSVTPSVLVKGQAATSGATSPVSFHNFSNNIASSGNGSCATISDSILANGAERGFSLDPATSAEGASILRGGVECCKDSAIYKYTLNVGPFIELDVCGTYQIRNSPDVQIHGRGSSAFTAASGQLTVSGCRQKDILGGFKPTISITQLTASKVTTYSWFTSARADISALPAAEEAEAPTPAAAAAAAAVGLSGVPLVVGVASPATTYQSSVAVKSAVTVERVASQPMTALVGEVTLTNVQVMPYIIAGARIILTGSNSSGSLDGTSKEATIIGNLTCPLGAQGAIIIPPKLLSNMPGTLRCTFQIPIPDSNFLRGTAQAQLKTLLSSTFEVDSGAPMNYTFGSNFTTIETHGCVNIYSERILQADSVTESQRLANPDLDAVLRGLGNMSLLGLPSAVQGRVPPSTSGLLAIPVSVCGNQTVQWTEAFGPFGNLECGKKLSVTAITIKPKGTEEAAISTALSFPIVVKGCGMVPVLSIAGMRSTARKTHTWAVNKAVNPLQGLKLGYSEQNFIKYDIAYNRTSSIFDRKLQVLIKLVNTLAAPVYLDEVRYSITRPAHQDALSGVATCNESASAAWQLAAADQAENKPADRATFILGPSPAAVAAAQAVAAAAQAVAAAQTSQTDSGLFGGLFLSNRRVEGLNLEQSNSAAAAAKAATKAAAEAVDPMPLYCSFMVTIPDSHPAKVSVSAWTQDGEKGVVEIPGPVNWDQAELDEQGRCGQLSAQFQQTQPATLLQPSSVVGTMPPTFANAITVCEPMTYSFRALFGPFADSQCGAQQVIMTAGISMPGSAALVKDDTISIVNITDCPDSLPILALPPPTPTQVVTSYEWTIERTLQSVSPAAEPAMTIAGPAQVVAPPAVATVLAAEGGMVLFNQTITFRRSSPMQHTGANSLYQIRGTVSILNTADKPMGVSDVQVKVLPQGATDAHMVYASCPKDAWKPDPSVKSGKVLLLDPAAADKAVVCAYGLLLKAGGVAEVWAVASVAADGRRAKSEKARIVELTEVKPVTLGQCAKVSELQQLVDSTTEKPLAIPTFIGSRVPAVPEQLCGTKSFQTFGQIGPLKASRADPETPGGGEVDCGGVTYTSAVLAEPVSGFQGRLLSNGKVDVAIGNC